MLKNLQPQIEYLVRLTDSIGLIEHTHYDKPDLSEGYSIDDQARAVQVVIRLHPHFPLLKKILPTYLSFFLKAFQKNKLYNDYNPPTGWSKNFRSDGEHLARTFYSLTELEHFLPQNNSRLDSLHHFLHQHLKEYPSDSPRVWAQTLLAISFLPYPQPQPWINKLVNHYQQHQKRDWHWFENRLNYDNFRLPLSLLKNFQSSENPQKILDLALASLDFLTQQFLDSHNNYFNFICDKNVPSQQPIEAGAAIETYSTAFFITGNKKYYSLAKLAFEWFHGQNIIGKSLINPKTGGVYDGLEKNGVNFNQGAESILAYLLGAHAFSLCDTIKT